MEIVDTTTIFLVNACTFQQKIKCMHESTFFSLANVVSQFLFMHLVLRSIFPDCSVYRTIKFKKFGGLFPFFTRLTCRNYR